MLSKIAPLVGYASAGWNIGWNCPTVPKVKDFDTERFQGLWYEIYRDVDHDTWSDQLCTMSYYEPKGMKGEDMTLYREYK